MRIHRQLIALSLALFCLQAMLANAAEVVRGPYLQTATPTSIIVKWRTDAATNSAVRYGTSSTNLSAAVSFIDNTTEHEVTLINLQPNTRYYYSIGTLDSPLAGDSSYTFKTAPVENTDQRTQIWVIGDAGTDKPEQREVRDAYKNNLGQTGTDLWIMLGDNAYEDGLDTEFQAGVFDVYPELLRQSALWSAFGNHDQHEADSATQSGPYYDIFSFPRNGEAGGLPSGTEAYYSFNYGNIHFICLDSTDSSSVAGSPMLTWLENDLAATSKDWIIAFFHHPPYSKGYHDADVDGAPTRMRENAVPILESYNVDLVLSGHNHTYERSYLINGLEGDSSSFNSSMLIDGGSGQENDTGAYLKPLENPNNAGTVYVVAGSSGKMNPNTLGDHAAMYAKLEELGSLVLSIEGDRLDAVFINESGQALDSFTISKRPLPFTTRIASYADDAEEVVASGNLVNASSDLELVTDAQMQLIGLRFTGIPLNKDAVITNAWVQFTVDEASTATTSLLIEGDSNPNPADFRSSTKISGRGRTQANVVWNPAPWNTVGAAGPEQRTPNLSDVLSEIINAPDWSAGDAVALIISGSGKRVAVAHANGNNAVADAATLHIEYEHQNTRVIGIDILPGDAQNVIAALDSNNPLDVSVLSTSIAAGDVESFDATLVDGSTVRFGHAAAAPIDAAGVDVDVDADGDIDRVFTFSTVATGILCEDTNAPLVGRTLLGSGIEGTDNISTPSCPDSGCHP